VGLVSHLFCGAGARSLASRIESLHLNGPLRAGTAAIARWLNLPCVVGKSILVSRAALNAIGGFAPLRDFLAEDFLIGRMVRSAGYRVVLSGDEIDTAEVSRTFRGVFDRHRRWAMMRRRLGGSSYALEILAAPFPWFAAVVAGSHGATPLLLAAALLLLGRYAMELAAPGHRMSPRDCMLLPLRDLLATGVFLAGLFGRTTQWRGRRIRIGPGTVIERERPDKPLTGAILLYQD
ncbi:MAG TPA: glycosyltransferase, partial [Thermoanaerobaculia bacterium]|nr:glycosyltransferase [Thermoanaerobaculia bacterium]